ncbi:hypothetical protein [Erwinia sp. 198]|uniref:hypothetical protein n=1 Tax=Erwinia sp. 198 TaxID=2022746 RepID=UPI000F6671A3|nr:hypothetical protein [Erwinia sp. 198]RRZ87552.1 hypothetical protein EGK14_19590 [Erwinia sp. 198]
MMDEMREKMHIDTKGINEKDLTTELLFNEPVTDMLSEYYAKQSYEEDRELTLDAYKEMYSEDNPVNLIIKFTVKNSQKKKIFS